MLRIYSETTSKILKTQDKEIGFNSSKKYVIMDENLVNNKVSIYDAYSDTALKLYGDYKCRNKKNGRKINVYGWYSNICLKQWEEPNVELIISVTYERDFCTLNELLELDAEIVLAYLRQFDITVNNGHLTFGKFMV